jgi:phage gp45-like
MIDEVKRIVAKAQRRAMRVVRRGIVKAATTAGFVQVQGGDDEHFDGAELWQQFGFTSRPAPGSEAIVLLVDGNPDQPIVIAGTLRGDRPSALASGDAMLWGTKSGSDQAQVHARADGHVVLNCASGKYVYVGGTSGAEFLLKGSTVSADMATFAAAIAAAATIADIKAAGANLVTAIGAGWLCAKATGV